MYSYSYDHGTLLAANAEAQNIAQIVATPSRRTQKNRDDATHTLGSYFNYNIFSTNNASISTMGSYNGTYFARRVRDVRSNNQQQTMNPNYNNASVTIGSDPENHNNDDGKGNNYKPPRLDSNASNDDHYSNYNDNETVADDMTV